MDEEFQKFLKDLNIHSGGSDGFENVEKYLSLDFAIDSKDFPNYSAIKEEAVRERLDDIRVFRTQMNDLVKLLLPDRRK